MYQVTTPSGLHFVKVLNAWDGGKKNKQMYGRLRLGGMLCEEKNCIRITLGAHELPRQQARWKGGHPFSPTPSCKGDTRAQVPWDWLGVGEH